jgi:hypothetical protein
MDSGSENDDRNSFFLLDIKILNQGCTTGGTAATKGAPRVGGLTHRKKLKKQGKETIIDDYTIAGVILKAESSPNRALYVSPVRCAAKIFSFRNTNYGARSKQQTCRKSTIVWLNTPAEHGCQNNR